MDHVDADHRIRSLDGPRLRTNIEVQRWADVGKTFVSYPGSNGRTRLWIGIAGLPFEVGQRPGKVNDVLPGPARDLQHETAVRQNTSQDPEDWPFVSLCRSCTLALVH